MRAEVEAKLGENAVCFFLQGAAGDINPLMLARSGDSTKDLPVVDAMGKALAGEVGSVLERLRTTAGRSDGLLSASKSITVENRWDSKRNHQVGVTTLMINSDIAILAMPGEPFHQFQVDWRREAAMPHALFFGYCSQSADPWAGYIPDIESAARGGYGASDGTQLAVGAGERLLNEGLAQLYTMQGRLKSAPQRHLSNP
jgi:hypothetical protein